ncbi:MAG: c(7)-type cytochrome triheme domain-containing protein [Thermodesulfobacteriota bacterium]|nr:c(7)-type cytochrome triheme domain-containing protein [Thermodesulfobacteriota bacterium]
MTFLGSLILFGCSNNQMSGFDRFLTRQEAESPANPIFQKKYTSASLPRAKLKKLLDMSLYTGPPEHYGNVVMQQKNGKHRMSPVVFSHRAHRSKFTCRVCHGELEFSMKAGETDITREECRGGFYCGTCHNGEIAFSLKYSCNACHLKVDKQRNYTAAHDALLSSGQMPEQDYGDKINWVEAISSGIIAPVNFILDEEAAESMQLPEHLELPLRWTTITPRTTVTFPHMEHVQWLDCANCHPDIFTLESMGTVEFDKKKNLYGMYCGACHMTVAFPMNGCNRCHPEQKDRTSSPLQLKNQ